MTNPRWLANCFCTKLFVNPPSTRTMTSFPWTEPAIFKVEGTTCPVRAWNEIQGASNSPCVSSASTVDVGCNSVGGSSEDDESSCSTIKHRNCACLQRWPGVNFASQLKQSPFSRRATISMCVRHLMGNSSRRGAWTLVAGVWVWCVIAGVCVRWNGGQLTPDLLAWSLSSTNLPCLQRHEGC